MASAMEAAGQGASPELSAAEARLFHDLYRDHFDFVFRNLCRLGVPRASADDALQDVFIVVLRRLGDYEPGTHPRAWLFSICRHVASDHRRRLRRKGHGEPLPEDGALPGSQRSPYDEVVQSQAVRDLHRCLDAIDEGKRSVFIMSELEELSAPEIARALELNVNTVYTRLRAARTQFAQAAERLHDAEGRR